MTQDSEKWKTLRANGGHAPVRFDVFCGQCGKLLDSDVDAGRVSSCGFTTDQPIENFCNIDCARAYSQEKRTLLLKHLWVPIL